MAYKKTISDRRVLPIAKFRLPILRQQVLSIGNRQLEIDNGSGR